MSRADLPIGVFDSGIGGLTVLDAIARELPHEDLLYLGDTARVPYGSRSAETVIAYSERVAGHLIRRGIKALVVACNTACTWAVDRLSERGREVGVPVLGVIEAGVERALATTVSGHIGVIGTEGTIRGARYTQMLRAARPDVRVTGLACPLFVPLAEEGWTEGEVARLVAETYLAPLRQDGPDTIILGCTHYPVMKAVIAACVPHAQLVDSATSMAARLARELAHHGIARADTARMGRRHFLVTDHKERFASVGQRFIDRSVLGHVEDSIELVDLTDDDGRHWLADAHAGRRPKAAAP